jgi:hypothetical protein
MEMVMAIRYQHTQRGTLMIVVTLLCALVAATAAYADTGSRWATGGLAIGMAILSWLFSSLTVIVNDSELRWYFGPGAWSYRMALANVEATRVVRNSWLNGFGIRMRPGFRLYNVSGLDAVELKLKSGEIRRIGTDDPEGLAAALQHG